MHLEPDRVRAHPLFTDLTGDQIDRVVSLLEVRGAGPGERLTPKGASGYTFFLIEDGTASVQRDGSVVRTLGPGDFFGEMAILGDGRRSADVIATSPMTLFAVFGTHFRELEAELPQVAAAIRAAAAERLEG